MPEQLEQTSLTERLRSIPGLAPLVAEAEATWRARAIGDGPGAGSGTGERGADGAVDRPAWRAFEDAFPTFYEFTNRPR